MQASFFVQQLRYRFRALNTVTFAASGAANFIRGTLGWNLRKIAGEAEYRRLFRPAQMAPGPSGLADWPRPFVLRASHLDGATVAAGEVFRFDVHLFETPEKAAQSMKSLGAAFEGMAGTELAGDVEVNEIRIDLKARPSPIARLRVRFCTPTELKVSGALVDRPEFAALFARARDRVATLQALYGAGPLEVDFAALGESARHVIMESSDLQHVERSRRSSRTGQTHGIGGFTGQAIYSGELAEFWPWLEAAQWTGVGRQTVWGKGQIEIWTMS